MLTKDDKGDEGGLETSKLADIICELLYYEFSSSYWWQTSQAILSERLDTVLKNGTTCSLVGLNLTMFPGEIEQVAEHFLTLTFLNLFQLSQGGINFA